MPGGKYLSKAGSVYYGGVKKYYTILEAALKVEAPEQKVYSLLREGKIKGFKRGGRWVIRREEVGKIGKHITSREGGK